MSDTLLRIAIEKFVQSEICPVSYQCVAGFVAGAHHGWGTARARVGKILQSHPKSGVPEEAICFFRDGDKWCCTHGDFINLQVSPAGFGETFEDALESLKMECSKRDKFAGTHF